VAWRKEHPVDEEMVKIRIVACISVTIISRVSKGETTEKFER